MNVIQGKNGKVVPLHYIVQRNHLLSTHREDECLWHRNEMLASVSIAHIADLPFLRDSFTAALLAPEGSGVVGEFLHRLHVQASGLKVRHCGTF